MKLPFSLHHIPKEKPINPARDWTVLFSVGVIGVLVLAIFSLYLYFQINKGELFLVAKKVEGAEQIFNKTRLKETVEFYESKEKKFEDIKNSENRIADPSL